MPQRTYLIAESTFLETRTVSPERAGVNVQSHAVRNGLICAFVVAACLWATYPVAEIGFIDDWSYAKTAQDFALTGHIVYNGWATAMLGWQVVWGALFIKLFGFSFTVVRLSMLPIAMATVFLFHAILLRFEVNPRNAVLGTLTLGLSPLFVPMAASYMTDVSGLFVIVLCLYLCQRAVAAESDRATIAWLCLAVGTNVVGGTVRQIAWLGALVMVPSTAWLLRKRLGALLTSTFLWVISAATIFACMRWYARQPYSVIEPILQGISFNRAALPLQTIQFLFHLLGAALCMVLLVYPILAGWLAQVRRLDRTPLLRVGLLLVAGGLFQGLTKWAWGAPWLPDVIWAEYITIAAAFWAKPVPFLVMTWTRQVLSLLVIATALVFVECVRMKLWPPLKNKTAQVDSWQNIWWLLGPFSLSYFALLLPRAFQMVMIDRYLLPLMPIAIICLLRLHQQWVAPTLPFFSVAVLAVFALLAIGGTHDWFAWYRARLIAINEVRASGVPRTAIQGGLEYDGWTQIEASGHVNGAQYLKDKQQPKITKGNQSSSGPQVTPDGCNFPFAPYMPAVQPKYSVVFPIMMPCLEPSNYPPVTYRTWLPPFKGIIYVQKIPDGSAR